MNYVDLMHTDTQVSSEMKPRAPACVRRDKNRPANPLLNRGKRRKHSRCRALRHWAPISRKQVTRREITRLYFCYCLASLEKEARGTAEFRNGKEAVPSEANHTFGSVRFQRNAELMLQPRPARASAGRKEVRSSRAALETVYSGLRSHRRRQISSLSGQTPR